MLRSRFRLTHGRLLALCLGLATAAALIARRGSASDHRDSALLTTDKAADIADVYTFRSPANSNNTVLAMTVSGFIPPAEAGTTYFDPNVLYQWKIDNNGDAVEDLVLQAYVTGSGSNQVVHFRGPATPVTSGTTNRVLPGSDAVTVQISGTGAPTVATGGGLTVFAGPRDDPFFFDLVQFKHIIAGDTTAFRNPGIDTFAGNDLLALVVELPSTMLGAPSVGVWGTTSRAP
jgi:hypothetical protein